jgi:DNA-binding CsgD family transcriptional regulator
MPQQYPVPRGCPLSRPQYDVIKLLAYGGKVKEVAAACVIKPSTVRQHKADSLKRLGVADLAEAKAKLIRHSWWDEDEPPDRIIASEPFLRAYLDEFVASRWPNEPDTASVLGMRLAWAGYKNARRHKDPPAAKAEGSGVSDAADG